MKAQLCPTCLANEIFVLGMLSAEPDYESKVHAVLRSFHVRGEWYEANAATRRLVEELCEYGLPLEAIG